MSSDAIPMNKTQDTTATASQVVPEAPRINIGLFADVRVALQARLGEAPITVEGIMALKPGAVVALETGLSDHVDLYLNDVLIARGEIVAVDGKYGVRIVEIAARP